MKGSTQIEKTTKMLLIEAKDTEGRDIRDILRNVVNETGSRSRAAASLGITSATIYNWYKYLGMDLHKPGQEKAAS